MKKILILIGTCFLSVTANALDGVSEGLQKRVIEANSISTTFEGTATCVAQSASADNQNRDVTVDLANLDTIKNHLAGQTSEERGLILQKLNELIDASQDQ
jgi:hypothetical protein